jgi:hypothetical protein
VKCLTASGSINTPWIKILNIIINVIISISMLSMKKQGIRTSRRLGKTTRF